MVTYQVSQSHFLLNEHSYLANVLEANTYKIEITNCKSMDTEISYRIGSGYGNQDFLARTSTPYLPTYTVGRKRRLPAYHQRHDESGGVSGSLHSGFSTDRMKVSR